MDPPSPNLGGLVIAVASFFLIISWIIVAMRMYCRLYLVRSFGMDDKTMLALLVIFSAYLGTQIYGATRGIGFHDSSISPADKTISLKMWLIGEILNVVSTCLLKISVGFFLLRFALTRVHRWLILLFMWSTIGFGTIYLFMISFQCQPLRTYWLEGPRTPGKCWASDVILIMTITATVLNTTADWLFGTLPYFMVRSMHLPRRTKIVVIAILSIAAVGSIATIIRAIYIPTLLNGEDFLYHTTKFAIWSTVEPGMGIFAACIATLRPLLRVIRAWLGFDAPESDRVRWRNRQVAPRGETERLRRQAEGGTSLSTGNHITTTGRSTLAQYSSCAQDSEAGPAALETVPDASMGIAK